MTREEGGRREGGGERRVAARCTLDLDPDGAKAGLHGRGQRIAGIDGETAHSFRPTEPLRVSVMVLGAKAALVRTFCRPQRPR